MIRGINSPNVSFLYCTPHVNPPGSTPRIHQHLDIDQGQVNWDEFFATLAHIGIDGIATVCVFA